MHANGIATMIVRSLFASFANDVYAIVRHVHRTLPSLVMPCISRRRVNVFTRDRGANIFSIIFGFPRKDVSIASGSLRMHKDFFIYWAGWAEFVGQWLDSKTFVGRNNNCECNNSNSLNPYGRGDGATYIIICVSHCFLYVCSHVDVCCYMWLCMNSSRIYNCSIVNSICASKWFYWS